MLKATEVSDDSLYRKDSCPQDLNIVPAVLPQPSALNQVFGKKGKRLSARVGSRDIREGGVLGYTPLRQSKPAYNRGEINGSGINWFNWFLLR